MGANPNGLPPLLVDPRSEPLVCIPVNKQWISILIGALNPLRYPEYWQGTLEENKQMREYSKQLVIQIMEYGECGTMPDIQNCCVDVYIIQRIDPITLQLQISVDNGITWQPAPGSAPTMIPQYPAPVPFVSQTKCDAASNGIGHIQDWVAKVTNDFDIAVTLLEFIGLVLVAIADLFLVFLTGGAITAFEAQILALIGGALAAVWNGGKALFEGYWTSDVYQQILCILYCNIGDDGSFTEEQYKSVMVQLRGKMGNGAAKTLFLGMLGAGGRQGLNNFCATGTASESDCSECDCSCFDTWTANLATNINPILASDGHGAYMMWSAVLTAIPDYRVNISNDGHWPSEIFDQDCCVPGDGRFHAFDSGTDTEITITGIFGYLCGDPDLEHFGAANTDPWWGVEGKNSTPFDFRIYETPW